MPYDKAANILGIQARRKTSLGIRAFVFLQIHEVVVLKKRLTIIPEKSSQYYHCPSVNSGQGEQRIPLTSKSALYALSRQ